MKQPTLAQWNALPETSTAVVYDFGNTRTVMKVDEETDGLLGRHLAGPTAWASLYGSERLDLVYVPGGIPSFEYVGPTYTLGGLKGLLEPLDQDAFLRMHVDGFLSTPGRPFHAPGSGDEVALAIGVMKQTVGEFLELLDTYKHLNREPEEPLVLHSGLPVRVRQRHQSDDAWSIVGAVQESNFVYLKLA